MVAGYIIPSLNSLNFAIASLMALFMSFFAVNLISATLLMITLAKVFACLSFLIIFIEWISVCYWFYRMISYWFRYGVILTKDNDKRDVFLHALGIASSFSLFISINVSCAGAVWWGAYDETGLAWFLFFLVFLVPLVCFFTFFYKGCYDLYKMEQAQKDRDSESIER